MKTWNQRLAEALRDSREYQGNANRFARDVGASAPSVAAWIGAGTIKPAQDIKAAHLLDACRLLHVTPEWVLFGRTPKSEENLGAFPNANDANFENSRQIALLISRLQNVQTEIQNILASISKGKPVQSAAPALADDMSVSSIHRTAEAAAKLLRNSQYEVKEHGKRGSKPPARNKAG